MKITENFEETWTPELSGNFVDDSHSIAQSLREEGREIKSLASSFYNTGNAIVAERLNNLSIRISKLGKDVSEVCGNRVESDLNVSRESTARVLGMVLGKCLEEPV